MNFEVGWTDDVRAAVARACGEVYAGSTIQECVDLMVARVERDRTLTIDIVVDGAGLRSVDVAPGDDPRERAAVACDGLEHTSWDDCHGASPSASPETAAVARASRRRCGTTS